MRKTDMVSVFKFWSKIKQLDLPLCHNSSCLFWKDRGTKQCYQFIHHIKWKKITRNALMFLSFRTDRFGQTAQTQIRLLLGAVWSGSTLFAISSASFGCISVRKSHLVQLLMWLQQIFVCPKFKGFNGNSQLGFMAHIANTITVMSCRSVTLLTLLLGRLRPPKL